MDEGSKISTAEHTARQVLGHTQRESTNVDKSNRVIAKSHRCLPNISI